jgi:hypothetical protein
MLWFIERDMVENITVANVASIGIIHANCIVHFAVKDNLIIQDQDTGRM